ncbi:MAG: helix-turn-helix transcriptional regulator [Acidobacteria bacterium]|nr:helix-turn-helix transcriptional regulator [Acidobacteriota bacterium]
MSEAQRYLVAVLMADAAAARQLAGALQSAGMLPLTAVPPAVPRPQTAADLPDACVVDLAWLLGVPDQQAALMDLRRPVVAVVDVAGPPLVALAADLHAATLLVRPVHDAQVVAAVRLAAAVGAQQTADAAMPRSAEDKLRAIAAILQDTPPAVLPAAMRELLSSREREIVELLWSGARVASIARHLRLSPHTVRNHLKSIFRKVNVRGQRELFEQWQGRAGR